MKEINKTWLREGFKEKCNIRKISELSDIDKSLYEAYCDVFNGAPFYESWNTDSAKKVIDGYIGSDTTILVADYLSKAAGFLVTINGIPRDQIKYVNLLDTIFIEEVGVINELRGNRIASELVRILLESLDNNTKYIGYRTNAMRYFEISDRESFESMAMRIQMEDKIKRLNGEKIIIPDFTDNEKQAFINKYIELVSYRPDLDVSNSSALLRDVFGIIDYNKDGNNYTFQKDPTGEGNDRIFPYVDLSKTLLKRRS